MLVDPSWDVDEERAWLEKVDMEAEKEALCLDLDQLMLSPPSVSDVPENLALSKVESLCLDLSNLIIDEGKNLQACPRNFRRSKWSRSTLKILLASLRALTRGWPGLYSCRVLILR